MVTENVGLPAHVVNEAHDALGECTGFLDEYMSALFDCDFAQAATYEQDLLQWAGLVPERVQRLVDAARAEIRGMREAGV